MRRTKRTWQVRYFVNDNFHHRYPKNTIELMQKISKQTKSSLSWEPVRESWERGWKSKVSNNWAILSARNRQTVFFSRLLHSIKFHKVPPRLIELHIKATAWTTSTTCHRSRRSRKWEMMKLAWKSHFSWFCLSECEEVGRRRRKRWASMRKKMSNLSFNPYRLARALTASSTGQRTRAMASMWRWRRFDWRGELMPHWIAWFCMGKECGLCARTMTVSCRWFALDFSIS